MTRRLRVATAPKGRRFEGRVVGVFLVLVLGCGLLIARLAQLQIIDPDEYAAHGREQRRHIAELAADRGRLLDRNGAELAVTLPQPTIYTDPALVTDPVGAARALAPVLGMAAAELEAKLAAGNRFQYLARTVDPRVGEQVEALGLDGVFVMEEPERFHPNGESLARSVLGRVDPDQNGISGLEMQYQEQLAGVPGELVAETSIDGRTIPTGGKRLVPARPGDDLVLTLDRGLQFEVERLLLAHMDEVCVEGGTVVIMEPATGNILALANAARGDDGAVALTEENRAITSAYEPGSVMKAMTFAALLDTGVATPDTERTVTDTLTLYDDTFVDSEVYGTMTMRPIDVLVRSSNTGTITYAEELGPELLHAYLDRFGFGQPTGVAFPYESTGISPPLAEWSGTSLATISLGQGIAVTPLQMLAAYNVIANDGDYVAPRLVDRAIGPDGDERAVESSSPRAVMSASAADELTDMLVAVAGPTGTGFRAGVPGYEIAAKTGTARKVLDNGTYVDEQGAFHYITTVAGFFPASDPRLSMIVVLDEPCGDFFASQINAPLFARIASAALRHLEIPPDTEIVTTTTTPTTPTGADDDAVALAEPAEGAP